MPYSRQLIVLGCIEHGPVIGLSRAQRLSALRGNVLPSTGDIGPLAETFWTTCMLLQKMYIVWHIFAW